MKRFTEVADEATGKKNQSKKTISKKLESIYEMTGKEISANTLRISDGVFDFKNRLCK